MKNSDFYSLINALKKLAIPIHMGKFAMFACVKDIELLNEIISLCEKLRIPYPKLVSVTTDLDEYVLQFDLE